MTIVIPGNPMAAPRPRSTRKGITYMPKEYTSWKATAHDHMQRAMLSELGNDKPLAGAVRMTISAYWLCPTTEYRKSPQPQRWRAKRPDIDNCAKAVMDAAIGVLVLDDAQVVELVVRKFVAAQGEPARVVVTLEAMEEAHVPAHPAQRAASQTLTLAL